MKSRRKWIFPILGVLIVAAAVTAGIFFVNKQTSRKEYTQQIQQAEKYLAEQDFENAILCYEAAIEADSGDEDAYLGIAEAYMEMSMPSRARYYLNLGLDHVSGSGQLQYMLGRVMEGTWESRFAVPAEEEEQEEEEAEEEAEIVTYKVKGIIVDAVTGSGVPDTTVTAIMTEKPSDSQAEDDFQASTGTKANGQYELELPEGTYRIEVICSGYIQEQFELTVSEQDIKNQNFTISPELAEGEIRIVLEWGAQPSDLDAYLFKNRFNSSNPVYFASKGSEASDAMLDVDDRDGYGPETITIYNASGNWCYGVHDFTESGNGLGASGATVKVYIPGEDPKIYTVPPGDGNYWSVCMISNGQVRDINKIGHSFSE